MKTHFVLTSKNKKLIITRQTVPPQGGERLTEIDGVTLTEEQQVRFGAGFSLLIKSILVGD